MTLYKLIDERESKANQTVIGETYDLKPILHYLGYSEDLDAYDAQEKLKAENSGDAGYAIIEIDEDERNKKIFDEACKLLKEAYGEGTKYKINLNGQKIEGDLIGGDDMWDYSNYYNESLFYQYFIDYSKKEIYTVYYLENGRLLEDLEWGKPDQAKKEDMQDIIDQLTWFLRKPQYTE